MNKFVLSKCEHYFSRLSHSIAEQIIYMDNFARSAQNEISNRDRLLTMIDIHADNMHYINDILIIKNVELVSFLCNNLTSVLLFILT